MKATKIILSLCLFFSLSTLKAQFVKLDISKINVTVKDQKFDGRAFSVDMKVEKSSDEISLFKNEQTEITAIYKIKKFDGTRRSNLKKTSIQLDISYFFYYGGKKVKKEMLKNFYLNDDRTFEETENAAFMNGISNTVIKISYTGILPQ